MLKWFGMLLVTAGGMMTGASAVALLRRRVQVLEAMLTALELMEGEIVTLLTPLPDVIARLAAMEQLAVQPLFQRMEALLPDLGEVPFSVLWERAIAESGLPFSADERRCLLQLGESLGRFDAEVQATALSRCMQMLERFREEARSRAEVDGRLYRGLGLSGGLLLAILFF